MDFDVNKWNKKRYIQELGLQEELEGSEANKAAAAIDKALEAAAPFILPEDLAKAFIIVARNGYQDTEYPKFVKEMVNQLRSVLQEIKVKPGYSTSEVAQTLENYVANNFPKADIKILFNDTYVEVTGSDKQLLDKPEIAKLTGYSLFSDTEEDRGYIVRFYPPK